MVTSEFHIPRVKLCFDGVLGAVPDMDFSIYYHAAPDGLTSYQRAERDAKEQSLLIRSRRKLDEAIRSVQQGSFPQPQHESNDFKPSVATIPPPAPTIKAKAPKKKSRKTFIRSLV